MGSPSLRLPKSLMSTLIDIVAYQDGAARTRDSKTLPNRRTELVKLEILRNAIHQDLVEVPVGERQVERRRLNRVMNPPVSQPKATEFQGWHRYVHPYQLAASGQQGFVQEPAASPDIEQTVALANLELVENLSDNRSPLERSDIERAALGYRIAQLRSLLVVRLLSLHVGRARLRHELISRSEPGNLSLRLTVIRYHGGEAYCLPIDREARLRAGERDSDCLTS